MHDGRRNRTGVVGGALPSARDSRSTGVRTLACAAAIVVATLVLTGCASSSGSQVVEEGREVYAANCAACHGANAEGQPEWHVKKADGTLPAPPLNGDGHTWHHADGELYRVVSQGGQILEDPGLDFKSAMPAFGEQLSHSEVVAVLTYLKSLWGDKVSRGLSIRESQALVSERDPFPEE